MAATDDTAVEVDVVATEATGAVAAAPAGTAEGSPGDTGRKTLWSSLSFWGAHLWVLGYCGVLAGAFTIQFAMGEFPCPLCMLQRYGMILSTLGALFIIMQARQGTLTPTRYMQGLGMGAIGALAGALVSTRQILLHIKPGDPGYGEPVMGLHLYSWALITFFTVLVYVGLAAMVSTRGIPVAPGPGFARTLSAIIIGLFVFMLVANVVAIILLEGAAPVLPDDPSSYGLIDQLQGKPIPQG